MDTLTREQLDEEIRALQLALHGGRDLPRQPASSWEDVATELLGRVAPHDLAYASERIRGVLAESIDFYSDDQDQIG